MKVARWPPWIAHRAAPAAHRVSTFGLCNAGTEARMIWQRPGAFAIVRAGPQGAGRVGRWYYARHRSAKGVCVGNGATAMGYSLKPRPGRGGARPGAGQPPFEPTKEQRRMVSILAGMGRPHKEIATLVVNPRTGKPIDDVTLRLRQLEQRQHRCPGRVRWKAAKKTSHQ